jgi:cell division protein FtsW (lipid II flippase)
MAGLIYPSVLGSAMCTFVSGLSKTQQLLINWRYFLMMLVVLAFYTTDYLYTASHKKMTWLAFWFNFLQIFLLYAAFTAVDFTVGKPNLDRYNLCLAATFFIFAYFDIKAREDYGNFATSVVVFEVLLGVLFVLLSVIRIGLDTNVLVSIVSYLLMAFFASTAYMHDYWMERFQSISQSLDRLGARVQLILQNAWYWLLKNLKRQSLKSQDQKTDLPDSTSNP